MMNIFEIKCNPVMDSHFDKRVTDANAKSFGLRRRANRSSDALDTAYADGYEQALRDLGLKKDIKAAEIFGTGRWQP